MQKADKVGKLDAFEACFSAWWQSLQPKFCTTAESPTKQLIQTVPAIGLEEPWEKIRVFGSNGLVSVLAALCFWGIPIVNMAQDSYRTKQLRKAQLLRWLLAVEDVDFVLSAL